MEKRHKHVKLYQIFTYLFLFFNITDIITTLLGINKHGAEYEVNIIYVLTGSITVMMVYKLIVMAVVYYLFIHYYHNIKYPVMRYIIIYSAVITTILLLSVSVNNYFIYKLSPEDIRPALTKEQKMEHFQKSIDEGASVNIAASLPRSIPDNKKYLWIFYVNIIQFLTWRSFEKWKVER